ncbi:hypothetical protein [Orenia marismortui]|uniref:Outer membrane protein n=1 Tax=Orenia marismortui TaxID=46469 RepID=A0A4R8GQA2_9FIRM|nr:hypothetical protein [Orenia marismortui]TDX45524.1 hypothetical protein C7959_14314 [Orenia marismortui]
MRKKSILVMVFIFTVISSSTSFAKDFNNDFEFLAGRFKTNDAHNLDTTIFTYKDNGANIFLPSELKLFMGEKIKDKQKNNYNILDFSAYKELKLGQGRNYIGLGLNSLNKTEPNAKAEGYTIPITLKTEQIISEKSTFVASLSYSPFGKYNVNSETLYYEGRLSGYKIDLSVKGKLTDTFDIKLGYLNQNYKFASDSNPTNKTENNQVKEIASYNESFNGLYLGAEISF